MRYFSGAGHSDRRVCARVDSRPGHSYENDTVNKQLPGSIFAPGSFVFRCFRLDELDVLCLETLGASGDGKRYSLAFLQAAKAI